MASLFRTLEDGVAYWGRHRWMNQRNFQYVCGPVCGVLCAIVFLFSLVAAHQFPAVKAYWTADEIVAFWKKHETGTKYGAATSLIRRPSPLRCAESPISTTLSALCNLRPVRLSCSHSSLRLKSWP